MAIESKNGSGFSVVSVRNWPEFLPKSLNMVLQWHRAMCDWLGH